MSTRIKIILHNAFSVLHVKYDLGVHAPIINQVQTRATRTTHRIFIIDIPTRCLINKLSKRQCNFSQVVLRRHTA